VQGEVEDAVMRLVAEGGEVDGSGDWRRDLVGRWELRLSTETPVFVFVLHRLHLFFAALGAVLTVSCCCCCC
jgi:hypothetical protein